MSLKIFNTLNRKIEEFKPIKTSEVGFYSCGPTVYAYPHIGNYRTYVSNDLVQRVLTFEGFKVKRVMNITDVGHLTSDSDTGEDKLEKGSKREGKTVWEIAEFYTADFFDSLKLLNVITPEIVCKATDHIREMIDLVQSLEDKGYCYKIDDGIYFDTEKLRDYGKLAKLDKKGLQAGARVEMVEGKKSPTDFALWKFSKKDEKRQMEWESPWGTGFPGWHIECSAMAMKYLGETLDIHSGGIDHIPVHHTNEIAQSEAATGKIFSNYWIHFAHLIVDGEKMSKSLGNCYTKNEIVEAGYSMLDLRYLFLNTHYRSTMNFTWDSLKGAKTALMRLREKIGEWKKEKMATGSNSNYQNEFKDAIEDDLNIPRALAVVWKMADDEKVSSGEKIFLISLFDQILGLNLMQDLQKEVVPTEVLELVKKRETARKNSDWKLSDELRESILKHGFEVKDTTEGSVLKKQN